MAVWNFMVLQFPREGGGYSNIGPHRAALLEAIARYGSLAEAAPAVELTARGAWNIVKLMNEEFGELIVVKRGRYSGGATLTSLAIELLRQYRQIEQRFYVSLDKELKAMEKLVGHDSKSPRIAPSWSRVADLPAKAAPVGKQKRNPTARGGKKTKRR